MRCRVFFRDGRVKYLLFDRAPLNLSHLPICYLCCAGLPAVLLHELRSPTYKHCWRKQVSRVPPLRLFYLATPHLARMRHYPRLCCRPAALRVCLAHRCIPNWRRVHFRRRRLAVVALLAHHSFPVHCLPPPQMKHCASCGTSVASSMRTRCERRSSWTSCVVLDNRCLLWTAQPTPKRKSLDSRKKSQVRHEFAFQH